MNAIFHRAQWGVLVGLLAACFCGCQPPSPKNSQKTYVATTGMIAEMVRELAGPAAKVDVLMGPGVDPHSYQATLQDNAALEEADAVFYNGHHLEGKMAEVLEKLAERPGKRVFALGNSLNKDKLRTTPEGVVDPHIWFDVDLWRSTIPYVRDSLCSLDPENAEGIKQRANAYDQRLAALHKETRERIAAIPAEQRVLITAHDAFGYFGRAYQIEVRGVQGVSTTSEPSLADKEALVNLIVERKIKAVFFESSVPPKLVESLIAPCQEKGQSLALGGELYSDAMGEPGSGAETYETMVRHNVNVITKALK